MIDTGFLEKAKSIRRRSLLIGIPSIDESEGFILYAITRTYSLFVKEDIVAADLGAGAGYSTLWILKALQDSGCRNCRIIVVERDKDRILLARRNLEMIGYDDIVIEYYRGDALEYADKTSLSFNILFIDIDKDRYPDILSKYWFKTSSPGLIIFHNAIFPSPPRRLFEIIENNRLDHIVLPTTYGILVIYKDLLLSHN